VDRKVIGCWVICNNASLNLYEIVNGIEDTAIVGINNDTPEEYVINFDEEVGLYIEFGGEKYSMDECQKIN
jgi:hypothetical protein